MSMGEARQAKLLIDCGNTRIKWARAIGGTLVDSGDVVHAHEPQRALEALFRRVAAGVETAWVASVLDDAYTAHVLDALNRGGAAAVRRVTTQAQAHGIRIAYSDPEALGVDRWLGMIAARREMPGPVCVVSVGTAVTFDAVDATGGHLGGFIWAGPGLSARALESETRRIGPTDVASDRPAGIDVLGRTTNEAVGRGSLFAIAAAIDRAVSIVAAASGEPVLLMTGGDADRILPWLECPATIRPELVLEGLLIVADGAG